MAATTVITITDDLDGTAGAEPVRFSLDGHAYEIDLTKKHAKDLRRAVEPYTRAARKVQARRSVRDRHRAAQVRSWAFAHGYKVSGRGRIPAEVDEAFTAALRTTRALA